MKQLSTLVNQAIHNLHIEALNPLQQVSIEAWKEGKDLILLSPTGTGKTLAYLLPLLETLNPDVKGVQAVVLVPSRELALQIDQVFKSMNTPYKVMSSAQALERDADAHPHRFGEIVGEIAGDAAHERS